MSHERGLVPAATVVLAAALALAGCDRDSAPPPAVGTLERDRIELAAEANEPVIEIATTEGAALAAGQLILRLDPAVYEAELTQARAARARAEQRLAELVRGPRRERILEASARADGARENLAVQKREHERMHDLVERALASSSELDQALARRELAEAQFDEAQAQLSELSEGTTPEELGQARAAVDESAAAVSSLEIAAARLQVRAPRAGKLEVLPYELGERPPRGATVAVLLADGAPYARIYVPEAIRARVAPGQQVRVRLDGIERAYAGTVRFVAADASFTPYYALTQRDRARLSYLAEVVLTEDEAQALPTGVPVEVDFPALAAQR